MLAMHDGVEEIALPRRNSLTHWISKNMFWRLHCVWKHFNYLLEVSPGRLGVVSMRNGDPQPKHKLLALQMSVDGAFLEDCEEWKAEFSSSGAQQAHTKRLLCAWHRAWGTRGRVVVVKMLQVSWSSTEWLQESGGTLIFIKSLQV